jgi:uncharacterized protein
MKTILLKRVVQNIFLFPVFFYRKVISPWLRPSCIYSPSCSQYMITAVHKHGIAKGFSAGILRIGRCHGSFFDGGKDPVPEEIIWKDLLADYKKFRHQKGIK